MKLAAAPTAHRLRHRVGGPLDRGRVQRPFDNPEPIADQRLAVRRPGRLDLGVHRRRPATPATARLQTDFQRAKIVNGAARRRERPCRRARVRYPPDRFAAASSAGTTSSGSTSTPSTTAAPRATSWSSSSTRRSRRTRSSTPSPSATSRSASATTTRRASTSPRSSPGTHDRGQPHVRRSRASHVRRRNYTGLDDELLVQLQMDPGAATIRVKITMDAATQQQISSTAPSSTALQALGPRRRQPAAVVHLLHDRLRQRRTGSSRSASTSIARDDADTEDPFTAVIRFDRDDGRRHRRLRLPAREPDSIDDVEDVDYGECDIDDGDDDRPADVRRLRRRRRLADNLCQHYVFPNIRSGRGHRRRHRDRRRDRRPDHDRDRHRHRRPEVRQRPLHDPGRHRRHLRDPPHQAARGARRRRPTP